MLPQPTVSAVIPTYESARYIADAIRSVLDQTAPIKEVIVVDDGSTDGTDKVVAQFGTEVRYIHQENAGPALARNRGMAAATGDWIAFLDADDRWMPQKTVRQLSVVASRPNIVLVAGDMAETDEDGHVVIESVLQHHGLLTKFERLAGRPVPDALATLVRKNFIPTGSVMLRRTAVHDVGMFDPRIRFGEDLELWARIAATYPIACVPEVLVMRRKHAANLTSQAERLLSGLVEVAITIRSWGAASLRSQGVDPDRMVAAALSDLGYWRFNVGQLHAARTVFADSLRARPSARALFYFGACHLPAPFVTELRRMKQMVRAIGGSS